MGRQALRSRILLTAKEVLGLLNIRSLRQAVHVQRALDVHEMLMGHNQTLDQALLEGTRLLNDRTEMLRRMPKGGTVAEIGVADGDFSAQILEICSPDRIHLVDPWGEEAVAAYSDASFQRVSHRFSDEIANGYVEINRGYSYDVLKDFPDDYFDWVYVDGAHDYAGVKRDLDLCWRLVKSGGFIAGHDYVRWAGPAQRYGVVEAVNEFLRETASELIYLTNQFEKHDSFALRLNKTGGP